MILCDECIQTMDDDLGDKLEMKRKENKKLTIYDFI